MPRLTLFVMIAAYIAIMTAIKILVRPLIEAYGIPFALVMVGLCLAWAFRLERQRR